MEYLSERLGDKKDPSSYGLVDIVMGKRRLTQEQFEAIVEKQARGKVTLKDLEAIATGMRDVGR